MNIVGIIAEYNPFHNGHLYQINKVKEMYPNSLIIAIISTNYTERGEFSLLNKWDKTKICLEMDIDLVIELPTLYAIQSADIFASNTLKLLNSLKIDTLVFGSESDNIKELTTLANIQLNNNDYDILVKKYLEEGINYPTALSKALYELTNIKIDKPNDLLALSYVKEIIKNNYHITPVSIKRTNDYHGKEIQGNIINASLVRELFEKNKDISNYVPKTTITYLKEIPDTRKAYDLLKYNIIINKDKLNTFLSVDEGIENRIIDAINISNSWQELVMNIKTKRYTYNKINRMLMHILLGIKKEDNNQDIYLRVLGFNTKGQKYLNSIKKDIAIPFFKSYKNNKLKSLDIELNSVIIYSLVTNNPYLIEIEKRNKPIIK